MNTHSLIFSRYVIQISLIFVYPLYSSRSQLFILLSRFTSKAHFKRVIDYKVDTVYADENLCNVKSYKY